MKRQSNERGRWCEAPAGMALDPLFFPKLRRTKVEKPIVLVGQPRSGTTFLQRFMCDQGYGADVVSEGEMKRALAAGIPAEDIVFSGVGKSKRELAAAP